ncbi:MAG TPA: hypothetical protein VGD94_01385 [Vicinamibacterales bacterium]
MRNHTCPHEHELLDALQTSRPADLPEPLHEHVAGCARCSETLSVVGALLAEREALMREAAVPSSAIVWWRAQMRSRREAAAAAARPISYAQGILVACAAGLLATLLGIYVPAFREGMSWIADAADGWSAFSLPIPSADVVSDPLVLAGIAALGLCALILPVLLYFAFHED